MPHLRAQALAPIPDHETIEVLLRQRDTENLQNKRRHNKSFNELTLDSRSRTDLATFVSHAYHPPATEGNGNVGHPDDPRMSPVLKPLFSHLDSFKSRQVESVIRIMKVLQDATSLDPRALASKHNQQGDYCVIVDTGTETTLVFTLIDDVSVRIMHTKDVEINDKARYEGSERTLDTQQKVNNLFNEPGDLSLPTQKYMIALKTHDGSVPPKAEGRGEASNQRNTSSLARQDPNHRWLPFDDRQKITHAALSSSIPQNIEEHLEIIQQYWGKLWTNNRRDVDNYRQYAMKLVAAQKVWETVYVYDGLAQLLCTRITITQQGEKPPHKPQQQ
ncbi:hypothetical protein F4778DRAFT_777288 [Xylariomycetidae sp. FL2044]|nr:hypothetical protein F4778DRAFT_777288 [Xylariomycetidae sp. FL2044]